MQKKGQAAMEFLMTYGWAILAAIIAIGVLAYFGVFNPNKLVSDSAALNAPMNVEVFNIQLAGAGSCGATNDCINMEVFQNSGKSITVADGAATVTFTSGPTGICTHAAAITGWSSGTKKTLQFDCAGAAVYESGDTVSGNIVIPYTKSGSSLLEQSTGTVRGTVQ